MNEAQRHELPIGAQIIVTIEAPEPLTIKRSPSGLHVATSTMVTGIYAAGKSIESVCEGAKKGIADLTKAHINDPPPVLTAGDLQRIIAALRFYADEASYNDDGAPGLWDDDGCGDFDRGEVARDVLARLPKRMLSDG